MPPLRNTRSIRTQAGDRKCCKCNQTAHELALSSSHGELPCHERLCQGLDDDNKPLGLPSNCMIPGCPKKLINPSAWEKHYKRTHQVVGSDCTLDNLHLKYHRDLLPDFDMNAGWGIHLTKKSPFLASLEIQSHFEKLSNPWSFAHSEVLQKYRTSFE